MKCCCGKILEVNLDTGEIRKTLIPDKIYEQVLSGKGLGAWYLLRIIPHGADPLGTENVLGFVSGALTGTGALMCGRWSVVTKSPLTGGWGDANCGGYFAPAIKQCGVDAIFFRGISKKPVFLYMDNQKAELRDASKYWGRDATDAELSLIEDTITRKKPTVAVIGTAGEKLSLISGICTDGGRISARSGVGAVMGSKRLKAVVLAGSLPILSCDQEGIHKVSRKLGKFLKKFEVPPFIKGGLLDKIGSLLGLSPMVAPFPGFMVAALLRKWGTPMNTGMAITSGDAPIQNWAGTLGDIPDAAKVYNADAVLKREVHKYHCYSCGIGCGGIAAIHDLGSGEFQYTHKPEYETLDCFGPLLKNNDLDSVFYINELINRAGLDCISAGNTVAFAIECFERGLITKTQTDGIDLTWGNASAIIEFVKRMIAREGIGDLFADGVKKAVERIGPESAPLGMHIGGQEPGMHDARNDPQLAVHFAAEPSPGKHTTGMMLTYGTLELNRICSWAPIASIHTKRADLIPNERIAKMAAANSCYSMLIDAAGGCMYGAMIGSSHWNIVEYLNLASGWNLTGDQYMEIGNRIQTMKQIFNIRQGIKPKEVRLPDRMEGRPPLQSGPLRKVTLQNEKQKQLYWDVFGWDHETGVPLPETISALGIDQLINTDVEKRNG